MGNGFPGRLGSRVLEFRLSRIQADPPKGRNGEACAMLVRIGLFGDDSSGQEAVWEEPFVVQLPHDKAAVSISILAREEGMEETEEPEERFLTQLCLPFAGPGCLQELLGEQPGNLPLVLKLALTTGQRYSGRESPQELAKAFGDARRGIRPDRPCLHLFVRELVDKAFDAGPHVLNSTSWTLPHARRQLISLELQHASLLHQRRKLMPKADNSDGRGSAEADEAEEPLTLSCTNHLELIEEENGQLQRETARLQQRLERCKVIAAASGEDAEQGGMDWKNTLSVMQQELAHCKDRQAKIRANYEERVAALQEELQQAWQSSSQGQADRSMEVTFNPQTHLQLEIVEQEAVTMEALIEDARMRRDDLLQQLSQARQSAEAASHRPSAPASPSGGLSSCATPTPPQSAQLGSELGIQTPLSHCSEDPEDLRRLQHDERERKALECELRQMRLERSALQGRLDATGAELGRLRTQGEALKVMNEVASDAVRPVVAELQALKEANMMRAAELDRLRVSEEEKRAAIRALEQEHEALREKVTIEEAPMAECTEEYRQILEAKAEELVSALDRTQQNTQEYEAEAQRLRKAASDAQLAAEVLRRNYQTMQLASGKVSIGQPRSSSLASRSSLSSTGQSLN